MVVRTAAEKEATATCHTYVYTADAREEVVSREVPYKSDKF